MIVALSVQVPLEAVMVRIGVAAELGHVKVVAALLAEAKLPPPVTVQL